MKTKLRSASFLTFFSVLLLLLGGSTLQAEDEVEVKSADPPSAPQGTVNLNVEITAVPLLCRLQPYN